MKKKFFVGLALVALGAGAFGLRIADQSTAAELSPLQVKNLEALTRDEGGSGPIKDQIPCYSSAIYDNLGSYVDCADCVRIKYYVGVSDKGTCTRIRN